MKLTQQRDKRRLPAPDRKGSTSTLDRAIRAPEHHWTPVIPSNHGRHSIKNTKKKPQSISIKQNSEIDNGLDSEQLVVIIILLGCWMLSLWTIEARHSKPMQFIDCTYTSLSLTCNTKPGADHVIARLLINQTEVKQGDD